MKNIIKLMVLFLCGGFAYLVIELAFRGYSHWTMFILGGILFVEIGWLNELFNWDMSLIFQGVIGSIIITISEFIAGLILNVWLNLGVWDYSNIPFNAMGQICLPFSLAWVFVSIAAVILDDFLRYWIFKEEYPHYIIFKSGGNKNGNK